MAALTAPRKTPQRLDASYEVQVDRDVAASTSIFVGALVCLDAAGNLVNGQTAVGLKTDGVAFPSPFGIPVSVYDNSSGSAGDIEARVVKGTFKFANSGGDPVTAAEVGDVCFVEDNQTVSATDGGGAQSEAGRVLSIDPATEPTGAGVWVVIE